MRRRKGIWGGKGNVAPDKVAGYCYKHRRVLSFNRVKSKDYKCAFCLHVNRFGSKSRWWKEIAMLRGKKWKGVNYDKTKKMDTGGGADTARPLA